MTDRTNLYNVLSFGAAGDGAGIETSDIQAAIDHCSEQGGGTVYFPNGTYVTGTLYMKSDVNLYLDVSARLLGSPDIGDYAVDTHKQCYDHESHMDRCLIYGCEVDNIGFSGPGTIDGQGQRFPNGGDTGRPMLLRLLNCRNIRLQDIRLQRPASWTAAFIGCDTVFADSLDIWSRVNENGDGLDFDCCQNVVVSNCKFDTSDDSICLQNSEANRLCRNIVIQNCIMTAKWAAIRIGLLSSGGIEDVTVSNCVIHDILCSGFKIQSTEGGLIRNMLFENIVMRNVPRPIFLTFNHYHMGVDAPANPPLTGGISSLRFNQISVTCDERFVDDGNSGIVLAGIPDHCIENISITNVDYKVRGGGTRSDIELEQVPEFTDTRPEAYIYENKLPSSAIYARHLRGLTLHNVNLQVVTSDGRPAFVCDDVEELAADGIKVETAAGPESLFLLHHVRHAAVSGIRSIGACRSLMEICGDSADIVLRSSDLRSFDRPVESQRANNPNAVIRIGNLE